MLASTDTYGAQALTLLIPLGTFLLAIVLAFFFRRRRSV